jgi:hypothetical protein
MKKAIFSAIVLSVLAFASFANAARPYGMAGCGLGSNVMGKDGSQVFAATTNGTSGSQTFGISTGSSNCTDSGTVAALQAVPAYIEANRESLSTDIARGNGETLAGLSHVMGCNDTAAFAGSLQKNYSQIFSSSNASSDDVTVSVMKVVKSNSAVSCRNVI